MPGDTVVGCMHAHICTFSCACVYEENKWSQIQLFIHSALKCILSSLARKYTSGRSGQAKFA